MPHLIYILPRSAAPKEHLPATRFERVPIIRHGGKQISVIAEKAYVAFGDADEVGRVLVDASPHLPACGLLL
jgi:hypothetical protein